MTINGENMMICGWWGLTSVTVRSDLAPEYVDPENHTWGILWDPKYAGRLSMIDSLIDGVMVAAIYSGAEDPFNMTPEEVAVTKKLMEEQLPLLRYYTNDVTSWEQALASGELVAAASWNSTPFNLAQQDIPVTFMNPVEGPMTWTCGMTLMSFADPAKIDRAYDLIDAFLSPSAGEFWVGSYATGHSNAKTYEAFSEEELIERGLPSRDVEAYIRCYNGEMARQLEQSTAEMTRDGFAKYLQDRNREIKGIAINEPEQASSNKVRVRVEYVYQDRNEAQFFYLEKAGSDWMITGADSTQRVPTLVPYGTPVY